MVCICSEVAQSERIWTIIETLEVFQLYRRKAFRFNQLEQKDLVKQAILSYRERRDKTVEKHEDSVSNPAEGYSNLLVEIKQRIRSAQYEALKAVNKELIALYWDIGHLIVTRQEGKTWGKSIVQQLAKDLQAEFPGIGGYSTANLWRMKLFYESYVDNEKLAPMVREISWSHNLVILEKCKDDLEREFYIRMARKYQYSGQFLEQRLKPAFYR